MDDEGYEEIEERYELAPMDEAAVALHVIYESLIAGGFMVDEAIRIVAQLILEQGYSEEL